MKIGDLAQTTGTDVQTIRFYEREGLLPAPARTAGNYRVYDASHAERLAFIRHCRSLDMALAEVRVLLHFKDAPHDDCGEVNALLDAHIGHAALRIRELKALQSELKRLRGQCAQAREAQDCGILAQLSQPAPAAVKQPSHIEASHPRTRATRGR